MNTNIIATMICVVLATIALRYFFAKARESKAEASRMMTDEHFIVKLPINEESSRKSNANFWMVLMSEGYE